MAISDEDKYIGVSQEYRNSATKLTEPSLGSGETKKLNEEAIEHEKNSTKLHKGYGVIGGEEEKEEEAKKSTSSKSSDSQKSSPAPKQPESKE